jgi:hypothetical protein
MKQVVYEAGDRLNRERQALEKIVDSLLTTWDRQ